jgi:ADP-ribosyl-[dinitrogen reductase] hydrolase
MTRPSLASRYVGTLIGAACGDALGATLEFQPRNRIRDAYPGGLREIIGGGWLDLLPGETTDDTALMLAIARACDEDGINLDRVAEEFVSWMETGPKDIGNATRAALRILRSGKRWDEAGEELQARSPDGIAGNGSVMRCAPVALRFRSSPDQLVRYAIDTSRITHADPRATWGCVAVCQALAYLLDGGPISGVVDAAIRGIPEASVVAAVISAPLRAYDDVRSGGYVLDTVNAAFWSLLHEANAEEVIVRAVNMGEDADTTGIVAGALAGAAYGIEAIPERWRSIVHQREELENLADRLLALSEPTASSSA